MSTEPLVTIPLSEYNLLIQQRDAIARQDLTVGRWYEIEHNGENRKYLCQLFAADTFSMVSNYGIDLKYLKITLIK